MHSGPINHRPIPFSLPLPSFRLHPPRTTSYHSYLARRDPVPIPAAPRLPPPSLACPLARSALPARGPGDCCHTARAAPRPAAVTRLALAEDLDDPSQLPPHSTPLRRQLNVPGAQARAARLPTGARGPPSPPAARRRHKRPVANRAAAATGCAGYLRAGPRRHRQLAVGAAAGVGWAPLGWAGWACRRASTCRRFSTCRRPKSLVGESESLRVTHGRIRVAPSHSWQIRVAPSQRNGRICVAPSHS